MAVQIQQQQVSGVVTLPFLSSDDANGLLERVHNQGLQIEGFIKQIEEKRTEIGVLEAEVIELKKLNASVESEVAPFIGPATTALGVVLGATTPLSAPVIGIICGTGAIITSIMMCFSGKSSMPKDALVNIKNAVVLNAKDFRCDNQQKLSKLDEMLNINNSTIECLQSEINCHDNYLARLKSKKQNLQNAFGEAKEIKYQLYIR